MANFFKKFRKEAGWYWFLLPFFILFVIFGIYPVFYTVFLSFCDADLMGIFGFVGFGNYTKLLQDPLFWEGFRNSFQITFTYLVVGLSLALFFAVLLNRKIRFKGFFRTLFFLPVITSEVAVSFIWQQLYNTDFGTINLWLDKVGFHHHFPWLTDAGLIIWSITILAIWQGLGYYMILFLAGLQSIPEERYEAAAIDGAGPVRTFFSITLPSLTSTVVLNAVLSGINILQIFTPIQLLSKGRFHSYTLGYHVFVTGFQYNYRGYASALAMLILIIVLLYSMLQRLLVTRWLGEE